MKNIFIFLKSFKLWYFCLLTKVIRVIECQLPQVRLSLPSYSEERSQLLLFRFQILCQEAKLRHLQRDSLQPVHPMFPTLLYFDSSLASLRDPPKLIFDSDLALHCSCKYLGYLGAPEHFFEPIFRQRNSSAKPVDICDEYTLNELTLSLVRAVSFLHETCLSGVLRSLRW